MPKWQSVVLITYQNFCFSVPTLTLSFHFRSFSNKKYIIQQVFVINVHLLTSPCIRTHDLFLVHESPPLTTKPGLRPKYQIFWCNKCMATFKICYKIEIKRLNKENSLALLFANKGSQIFGHPSQLRYTRIGKTSVLSSFTGALLIVWGHQTVSTWKMKLHFRETMGTATHEWETANNLNKLSG